MDIQTATFVFLMEDNIVQVMEVTLIRMAVHNYGHKEQIVL